MNIKAMLAVNGYKSKDGKYPVYVKVSVKKKRTLVPVGARVKKTDWDKKNCRVKPEHPNAQDINLKIIDLLNSLEKNYIKDQTVTTGDMDNFYWWFDERLAYTKKALSGYHYSKLNAVKTKLQAFAPRLPFRNIDHMFLLKYEQHLASIGNQPNTIADNLYRIRTIVNMITKKFRDWPSPFSDYKFKTTKVAKKRLSFDQVMALWLLPLHKYPQRELAVHMYVYSYFNAGIRWGDLTRIRIGDLQEQRLRYTMHKTKQRRNIKQIGIAWEIAKKYSKGKRPTEYLFDTGVKWRVTDKKEDIDLEEQSINDRGTLYNKYLKEVCRSIDIPEVTYHTARHSFADYTKQKKFDGKFDIHTLKDLFGHSSSRITEIYLQGVYEEESDLAMDQLFGPDPGQVKPKKKKK